MLEHIKKYWLAIIVAFVIIYLSLMKQPSAPKLQLFEGIDKVVHFLMYFGLSSMLWLEHLWKYKNSYVKKHLIFGAVLAPIAFGGLMEIAQGMLTDDRACELYDFLSNSAGVLFASLLFVVIIKVGGRYKGR